jgi:hypothetical protein
LAVTLDHALRSAEAVGERPSAPVMPFAPR